MSYRYIYFYAFSMYFYAFSTYLNVFVCIFNVFQCISMCFKYFFIFFTLIKNRDKLKINYKKN
jgi:hypothetical protein